MLRTSTLLHCDLTTLDVELEGQGLSLTEGIFFIVKLVPHNILSAKLSSKSMQYFPYTVLANFSVNHGQKMKLVTSWILSMAKGDLHSMNIHTLCTINLFVKCHRYSTSSIYGSLDGSTLHTATCY